MGTTLLLRILGALRPSQRAMSFPARRSARAVARGLASCALVAGCGDSNGLTSPASFENATRQYSVYALSGTSSALPAAYQFTSESLIRPLVLSSGSVNFDVAFDLAPDGRVRIMPVRALVPSPPNPAPPIGLLRTTAAFEQLTRAPERGYLVDSVVVAAVGETVVFELLASGCVYGEAFYAKLTVDSIIATERRMVVRSLVNRNCGYRALTNGVPRD